MPLSQLAQIAVARKGSGRGDNSAQPPVPTRIVDRWGAYFLRLIPRQ